MSADPARDGDPAPGRSERGPAPAAPGGDGERLIELRLRDLGQLFNSMDPTPFRHKDLDPDAEEFVESWAMEFPLRSPLLITVYLENPPAEGDATALVGDAIRNYFGYKAELVRRDLRQLLREGRVSLAIGLAFLALCLVASNAMAGLATGAFLTIVRESLTIGGWVAMWRPLQIFLYDWWPLTRRGRVMRNLARARIRVVTGPS